MAKDADDIKRQIAAMLAGRDDARDLLIDVLADLRWRKCSTCRGTGEDWRGGSSDGRCEDCGGSGEAVAPAR